MEKKFGIKETKEFITLLAVLTSVGDASMADGKIDFSDIPNLMALIPVAQPGIQGVGLVGLEMSEIDAEEKKDLETHIDAKFGPGTYSQYGEEILQAAVHVARVFSIKKPVK